MPDAHLFGNETLLGSSDQARQEDLGDELEVMGFTKKVGLVRSDAVREMSEFIIILAKRCEMFEIIGECREPQSQ